MKNVSKVISILLVAIMTLSVFAVSASAVATPLVAGNTKETATKIPSYGTEYVSELSKAGEQDWFKFTTLSQDAYYTVSLENYSIPDTGWTGEQLNLYIYDTYNRQLANLQRTSSTNIKFEKNTTYYIKVEMGYNKKDATGNYELLITYKLDPVSNVKEEALSINVNTTYKYSLDGTGDCDWYKFTAPVDGKYKIVLENYDIPDTGWTGEQLNLYVYDVYNKQLVNIQRSNSANVDLEKNVTYYIKVAMGYNKTSATGNYGFSVNCEGAPVTPPPSTTKTLSSISIAAMPTKTTYTVGESFEQAGLVVKATYSDGSTANVSGYTIAGFDSSKAGTSTVTVTYKESGITRTAAFNVTIEEKKADDPSTPSTPGITVDFDFMAILTTVWNFIVQAFNFLIGLFNSI